MPFKSANSEDEYKKCPELKPEGVKQFLDWMEKQPHLPNISELQAILFLQSCYYRHEAAKIAIDNFFTIKTLCFDIFGNRNPLNPSLLEPLDAVLTTILPKRTPEGYIVSYTKILSRDPSAISFDQLVRIIDMVMMLHLNRHGTNNGVQIIFDMDGFMFEAMPIRLKGIHYVNVVPFVDKVLALMKPFIKKELMNMMHVHCNPLGLYKFVPQSCMPEEFGGTCGSISEIHEKCKLTLQENADFFQNEDQQLVDESKRLGAPKNVGDYFGIDGTFKKLQID